MTEPRTQPLDRPFAHGALSERERKAVELLRHFEWADDGWCPICPSGVGDRRQHAPGCELAAVLALYPEAG